MDRDNSPVDIHQRIVEFIDGGQPFVVALVLNAAEGSTPQKAGVRAVIDGTGRIWGTIGGGFVEGQAQQYAVDACKSGKPILFDFDLANTYSRDAGAICGGNMRILVDPTAAENRDFYARAAETVARRQRGIILTTVRTAEHPQVKSEWFDPEAVPSDVAFPGANNIRSCMAHETPQLFTESSTLQVLVEPVIPKPMLLIAGGGHIGQALALQANLVGFDVTVIDDRAEFTDPALFPEGTTTCCEEIPKKIADLSVGSDTYVVLVTRGHKLDAEGLEACIHAPVAYVGMIGSDRKVSLIRENFLESGLAAAEEFDRVFTPIGLDIGAVTVPEIAASITAELIAVRRKGISHKPSDATEQS